MQKEETHPCQKKWMIDKDSIHTTLVGVQEVDRLCLVANIDLHSTLKQKFSQKHWNLSFAQPKNSIQQVMRLSIVQICKKPELLCGSSLIQKGKSGRSTLTPQRSSMDGSGIVILPRSHSLVFQEPLPARCLCHVLNIS